MSTKEQLAAVENAVDMVKSGQTKKINGDGWLVYRVSKDTVGIYLKEDEEAK